MAFSIEEAQMIEESGLNAHAKLAASSAIISLHFLKELSSTKGVPIEQLTVVDILQFVKESQLPKFKQ